MDKTTTKIKKYEDIIESLKLQIEATKREINEKEKNQEASVINTTNDEIMNVSTLENNENSANNNVLYDKINQCQQQVTAHFKEEIKLKKIIIDQEKVIEQLKNELNEQANKISKNITMDPEVLKKEYGYLENKIKSKKDEVSTSYEKFFALLSKRKSIQKEIISLTNNDFSSMLAKNLLNTYKYYTALIENISSEHRKYLNICELKRKEKKVQVLTSQLNLRDNFIVKAGTQIAKNKVDFRFHNPKFLSADELDLYPYRPNVMKVSPSLASLGETRKEPWVNQNNNRNLTEGKEVGNVRYKSTDNNDKNNKKAVNNIYSYNHAKELNSLENLSKSDKIELLKRQIQNETKITQKRQYNNELMSLFYRRSSDLKEEKDKNGIIRVVSKPKPAGLNLQKFQRGANSRGLRNLLRSTGQKVFDNNNFRGRIGGYGYGNKRRVNFVNTNENSRNLNVTGGTIDSLNATQTTRLENEVQKKVKTILKKDIIGRYKNSPYSLDNF